MLLEPLLAMNDTVPEGVRSMAEGTLPVGTEPPFAVSRPVLRSMLKDVTDESPWLATNTAPVPAEEDDELPLMQAFKPTSRTGTTIPARNRNLVPILFCLPVLSPAFRRALRPVDRGPKVPSFVYQE